MVQAVDSDEFQKIKLVFVGDTTVGKTSLINVLNGEEFPTFYEPTCPDGTPWKRMAYKGSLYEL